LFRAVTVPGIPPFRAFPSQEIASLSRGSLAPLQLSTGVLGRTARALVTSGFADSHALTQSPGSPRGYGLPFRVPRHASRSPWRTSCGTAPFRQLHLLRSFSPSRESVHNRIGSPLTGGPILSWVSSPLEPSPSTPRILDPPQPEGSGTRPSSEESGRRDPGDRGPPSRVRPFQHESTGTTSSAASSLLRDRPAPPLGGVSFSLDLGTASEPAVRGLRSF
jgi:hypothetical protein